MNSYSIRTVGQTSKVPKVPLTLTPHLPPASSAGQHCGLCSVCKQHRRFGTSSKLSALSVLTCILCPHVPTSSLWLQSLHTDSQSTNYWLAQEAEVACGPPTITTHAYHCRRAGRMRRYPSGKPVFVLSTEAEVGFAMHAAPGRCRHRASVCQLLPPSWEPHPAQFVFNK